MKDIDLNQIDRSTRRRLENERVGSEDGRFGGRSVGIDWQAVKDNDGRRS